MNSFTETVHEPSKNWRLNPSIGDFPRPMILGDFILNREWLYHRYRCLTRKKTWCWWASFHWMNNFHWAHSFLWRTGILNVGLKTTFTWTWSKCTWRNFWTKWIRFDFNIIFWVFVRNDDYEIFIFDWYFTIQILLIDKPKEDFGLQKFHVLLENLSHSSLHRKNHQRLTQT